MATINNIEVQGDKNGNDYGLANLTDLASKDLELTNKILANKEAIEDNLSEINLHKSNEDRHVTPALINSLVRKETLGLYYTAAQVAEMINDISVGGGAHLKFVDELPQTGLEQIIYFVPNGQTGDNVKDEYIWIDNKWEVIGSTRIDLTDYYTKNEVNSKISNLDSKYVKSDDTTVVRLNNLNEVNLQEDHYNAWFGYRGGEVTNWKFGDGTEGGYANVYAKEFYLNDQKLSEKLNTKADKDNVYTKTEVDTKVSDLVSSAPETLDTLNELASALGNDPNFATTIANQIGAKANDSDVVHKSGNETISGIKTFNDLHVVNYGTQYKGSRNAYILPQFSAGYSGLIIATLGFGQSLKIGNYVLDDNNNPALDTSKAYIQIATGENNGVNTCLLESRNSTFSSLGTSINKWKTINGINPGALSLPSISTTGANAWIALDTTDWIKAPSASAGQKYTPLADGWLNVRVDNATLLAISVGGNYMHQMVRSENPNSLALLMPVFKNEQVTIMVNGNENLTYTRVTFYYCQGNV